MNGEQMRALRQGLRLSQAELKDALNRRLGRSYDKPKISRWENGREPIPEDVAMALESLTQARPRTARAFARGGWRVLLVDLDPQATATVGLLADAALDAYRQRRTMAHVVLGGRSLAEVRIGAQEVLGHHPPLPFDLAASHIELAETDGRREPGMDATLREALEELRGEYDFIVIDAPPNLGMLTWMALAAAEEVIIPVRTEPYDTMGVGLILATITKVQRRLNPSLRLAGILPTQYGRRKSVDREVLAHLIAAMDAKAPVLEPIPDSAAFGHAARNGRIALDMFPHLPAVGVYATLAQHLAAGTELPRASLQTLET